MTAILAQAVLATGALALLAVIALDALRTATRRLDQED